MPLTRRDLLGVDPNEFVTRRDELARELRGEGDKTGAAEIKKLRRPSVAVWALNGVARDSSALVAELVEVAEAARAAQLALLEGGDADDFRAILARRRAASAAVADAAGTVIDDSGRSRDTYTRDVEDALNLVVGSPDLVAALGRAELVALPAASDAGDVFAGFEAVAVAPTPKREPRPKPPRSGARPETPAEPDPPKEPSARLVQARGDLERRRAELANAEKELRKADATVAAAETDLSRARKAVDRTEAQRDTARRERDRRRTQVERAEQLVERYDT